VGVPVFLSYPKPHTNAQEAFVRRVSDGLRDRGLEPKTLGVTEYDMDAPLTAIRRLMLESNGLITIAFRRTFIDTGCSRLDADIPGTSATPISRAWLTSPYSQIEPAMAFQLGLPILILRETGVIAEGLLEKGVVGLYMPEFTVDAGGVDYLGTDEWRSIAAKWEQQVRSVREAKGKPPTLFL